MSKPIYATPCISLNGVSTGTGGAFAMDRARNIRAELIRTPGATYTAGKARVEAADSEAYSGVWSRIDDIGYADDNWSRYYTGEGHEFVRMRITEDFVGGTIVGKLQGFD